MTRFLVDVNRHFVGKVTGSAFARLNKTFQTEELDAAELLSHIRAGHAWTAPHRKIVHAGHASPRVKQNVLSVQAFALDSDTEDERSTLAYWKREPFFAQFGAFVHTTPSHTEDAPRCRPVFVLSAPVDVQTFETGVAEMLERWNWLDSSCSDASRLFFGAKACDAFAPYNVLPVDVFVAQFVAPRRRREEQAKLELEQRRASQAKQGKANAGAERVAWYVASAKTDILDEVASAKAGTGDRHATLRNAAIRLESFARANWLSDKARDVLASWEAELLAAAGENGYIAKYGEPAAQRVIDSGREHPSVAPAVEPVWKDVQQFFRPGDSVAVLREGKLLKRGTIEHMRQAPRGRHWEARVAGVWFPRDWLRHAAAAVETREQDTPGTPPARVTDETGIEQPEPVTNGAQRQTQPPPPPNFPDYADAAENPASPSARIVHLPDGKYLSDVLSLEDLPERTQLESATGSGKTFWAMREAERLAKDGYYVVFAASTTASLWQLRAKHPDTNVYYGEEKDIDTRRSGILLTTYNSLARARQALELQLEAETVLRGENMPPIAGYVLFVDEVHNVGLANYRQDAIADTLGAMTAFQWTRIVTMTGTPVETPLEVLDSFAHVRVASTPRQQNARIVLWRDSDEGKGRREDTAVRLILEARAQEPDKPVLAFYDNKAGIGRVAAKLRARGLSKGLYQLTSDNKFTPIGKDILERERLPEDAAVLFFTSVYVESCNLYAPVGRLIVVDAKHPAHYQQAVARTRGQAIPLVDVLTTGTGRGFSFDMAAAVAHYKKQAQGYADLYNAHEAQQRRINDTIHWHIDAAKTRLVERDAETGRFVENRLAVVQHAHSDMARYAAANPEFLKRYLARYGWAFGEDVDLVVDAAGEDKELAKREKQLLEELRSAEKENWLGRLSYAQQLGRQKAEKVFRQHKDLSPAMARTLDYALRLGKQTADYDKACHLLATTPRDTEYHYTNLTRAVVFDNIQRSAPDESDKERREAKAWLDKFAAQFTPGEHYTAEQRYKLAGETFLGHWQTALSMLERPQRYWNKDEDAKPFLTQQDVDRLIKALYSVKSKRLRVDEDEDSADNRVYVYVIGERVDVDALAEKGRQALEQYRAERGELVEITTKREDEHRTVYQRKIAGMTAPEQANLSRQTQKPYIKTEFDRTAPAFAFQAQQEETAPGKRATADEIPFTPDEVAAYQRART